MSTKVALVENEHALVNDWNRERIDLMKRTFAKGTTDDEFQLFIATCKRTGLSPEARQVFAVKRWDSNERKEVMSIQVSIDGFRLIAQRSGQYAGQLGPFWYDPEMKAWVDVWIDEVPPAAAKVAVLRNDFKEPLWGVARFDSYAQKKKDGGLTAMWAKMPDLMLAKCAEALALRKAFPQELSGLYTVEEMQQAAEPEKVIPIEKPRPGPQEQPKPAAIAEPKPGYNPDDPKHQQALLALLLTKTIDSSLYDEVGKKMAGKNMKDLDSVIAEVLA